MRRCKRQTRGRPPTSGLAVHAAPPAGLVGRAHGRSTMSQIPSNASSPVLGHGRRELAQESAGSPCTQPGRHSRADQEHPPRTGRWTAENHVGRGVGRHAECRQRHQEVARYGRPLSPNSVGCGGAQPTGFGASVDGGRTARGLLTPPSRQRHALPSDRLLCCAPRHRILVVQMSCRCGHPSSVGRHSYLGEERHEGSNPTLSAIHTSSVTAPCLFLAYLDERNSPAKPYSVSTKHRGRRRATNAWPALSGKDRQACGLLG